MKIRVLYFLLCLMLFCLCLPVFGAEPENQMSDAVAVVQPAVDNYAYSPMGAQRSFQAD